MGLKLLPTTNFIFNVQNYELIEHNVVVYENSNLNYGDTSNNKNYSIPIYTDKNIDYNNFKKSVEYFIRKNMLNSESSNTKLIKTLNDLNNITFKVNNSLVSHLLTNYKMLEGRYGGAIANYKEILEFNIKKTAINIRYKFDSRLRLYPFIYLFNYQSCVFLRGIYYDDVSDEESLKKYNNIYNSFSENEKKIFNLYFLKDYNQRVIDFISIYIKPINISKIFHENLKSSDLILYLEINEIYHYIENELIIDLTQSPYNVLIDIFTQKLNINNIYEAGLNIKYKNYATVCSLVNYFKNNRLMLHFDVSSSYLYSLFILTSNPDEKFLKILNLLDGDENLYSFFEDSLSKINYSIYTKDEDYPYHISTNEYELKANN